MKRVIDLDEVMIGTTKYYKVRGCKTMFFDQWGFDNLTKKFEERPLLNCDFVVTQTTNPYMAVGQFYSVKNGKFTNNSLASFPSCDDYYIHSIEELESYFKDDFDGGETKIAVMRY